MAVDLAQSPVAQEILRCRDQFPHFAAKYAQIKDKATRRPTTLVFNEAQQRLQAALDAGFRWIYCLKARQLGSSTYFLARMLWRALLRPGYQALVVAHTNDAVRRLFQAVRAQYTALPNFLQVPTVASSTEELQFTHGGGIRVTSSESVSGRGQSYDCVLMSEYAWYPHAEEAVAAILQTLAPNGEVYIETTAKGLNHAHQLWTKPQGYTQVFLSWRLDPTARLAHLPSGVDIPGFLHDYALEHSLSAEELNWAAVTLARKCLGNWDQFNQEYPISAEVAFITSGARVFQDLSFPDATLTYGYQEYDPPQQGRVYSLGGDVAGGSPDGDFSAFAILDVTDTTIPPSIAASYYGRLAPIAFGDDLLAKAHRYHKALVTLDTTGIGYSLQDYLVSTGYPRFYKRVRRDKIADRMIEAVGFNTSETTRTVLIGKLHQHLRKLGNLDRENRAQFELNSYVYDKSGRPDHDTGCHDDMITAIALALVGAEQCVAIREETVWKRRPHGVREVLEWEEATGLVYGGRNSRQEFQSDFDEYNNSSVLSDVLGYGS